MKNYKGILVIVTLFCMNNLFAAAGQDAWGLKLDTILKGVLRNDSKGVSYASKVRDIISYDYTKEPNKPNLRERLQDKLRESNQAQDTAMLKKGIDILHAMLATYSQQKSVRPLSSAPSFTKVTADRSAGRPASASLSLQSILDGALGEPYTAKVNEIYNSNAVVYVDALVKEINNVNKKNFLDEAQRISAIKSSIDKNYSSFSRTKIQEVKLQPQELGRAKMQQKQKVRPQSARRVSPVPASLSLQSILDGALGEPYTTKANEIYNSNVSVYVDALVKDINGAVNSYYSNESKRISVIKLSIDKNYKFLENYRKTNQPPVAINRPQSVRPLLVPATAPAASLSLQSILDGALGEPYTTKANEIYNSNVTVYIDALVKDINGAINSYYPNESKRISVIKLSIDKNYKFLENYRRSNE